MNAPLKGVSAGSGLAFDDSLTLSISTGAANIATVDGRTERMTVTSDGTKKFSFPVSLALPITPPMAAPRSSWRRTGSRR